MSACQLLAAAPLLALALPVTGARAPHIGAASLTGLVILGVLGTGIAYVLNYQIITSKGATIASTVTCLLPVVAIVLGAVVLGETVTAAALAGIAMVLPGVALTRHRQDSAVGEQPQRAVPAMSKRPFARRPLRGTPAGHRPLPGRPGTEPESMKEHDDSG